MELVLDQDEDPSRRCLEYLFEGIGMSESRDPIKLGNNKIVVYDSYSSKKKEIEVPNYVRKSPFKTKVAASGGKIYYNGYVLDVETEVWKKSFRGFLICLLLP
jgi:hypothetical protein